MKKQRGKTNPTKLKRAYAALAECFFQDTPMQRFIFRCGRARDLMRKYRVFKGSRRPQFCRQDVW